MLEDELRAAFARHESQAPSAEAVAAAIEEGYRRRRRRGRLRSAGVALAVAAMVAVPSIAVAVSRQKPLRVPAASSPAAVSPAATPLNILILGTDARSPGQRARSDAIIVVHIPATRDGAYVMTVPRDTAVTPPGYPTMNANAPYFVGGMPLAEKTIGGLLGVTFDAAAVTTFDGLSQIVSVAGGVELCVDQRTISIHIGHTKDGRFATPYRMTGQGMQRVPGVTPEVYEVGCHHFAGWQAVDYVRQRMLVDGPGGAGAVRDKHIRDLLQALARQVLTNPVRAAAVLKVASQAVTVDTGGMQLLDWLRVLSPVSNHVQGLEYDPRLGTQIRQAFADDDLARYLAGQQPSQPVTTPPSPRR